MAPDDRRRTLLPYLAGAVVLVLLAMRALGGGRAAARRRAVALDGARPQAAAERPLAATRIWVHVAGAVRRPGLYRVAADARAGEAVDAAGGLARRADLRAINLAATVRDGQQVIVPARGERPPRAAAARPGRRGRAGGGASPGAEPPAARR